MKKTTEPFIKVPRRVSNGASGNELKIYCYLAGLPDFSKIGSYPRRKEIARRTGLSHNTVDSALNSLIEKGFIMRERAVVSGSIPRTVYRPKNGAPMPQKMGR